MDFDSGKAPRAELSIHAVRYKFANEIRSSLPKKRPASRASCLRQVLAHLSCGRRTGHGHRWYAGDSVLSIDEFLPDLRCIGHESNVDYDALFLADGAVETSTYLFIGESACSP